MRLLSLDSFLGATVTEVNCVNGFGFNECLTYYSTSQNLTSFLCCVCGNSWIFGRAAASQLIAYLYCFAWSWLRTSCSQAGSANIGGNWVNGCHPSSLNLQYCAF